jgi:hypothetical protein
MNESIKKLIAFLGASLLIGILIFMFSGGGDSDDGSVNDSIAVKEFKLKCDSLRLKKWNQQKYKSLNSALVAMKSQEIFNIQEVSNIKIYLNQAYATTLKDSCASWLRTNGNDCDKQLYSEMQTLAGISETSKMLSSEIQIMRAYFSALLVPSKIRLFTQSNYTLEKYNSLISEINSTAKKAEIRHFSSMNRVASVGIGELNNFKNYVEKFDGAYAYYLDRADVDAADYLQNLCPDKNPRTRQYNYYLQKLSIIENLCN